MASPFQAIRLIYHDVVPRSERASTGFAGPGPDHYKIEPDAFERHVAAAGDAEFTFDDGGASALAAAEILERHGRRGAFFVVSDRVGTPGFLDAAGVLDLRRRGHEVGSHGATHRPLTSLSDDELRDELERSRDALESMLGEQVTALAIPGGYYDARVGRAAAAAGYVTIYTSRPGTRARTIDGATVLPRYSVVSDTPAERVAAIAHGDRGARLRAYAGWRIRSAARAAAGPLYARVRARTLARRQSR